MSQLKLGDIDVVILCGGLGKRLRSVDSKNPKAMVKFNDRPFMDILLEQLKGQGLRRFVLCTGYKAGDIEEYYKKNNQGLEIVFSREEEPLGTGGAIRNASELIQSSPFFALNGDCYSHVDYKALLHYHFARNSTATLTVAKVVDNKDFGSIDLDPDNRILAFREKQELKGVSYVNVGIYCYNKEIFSYMPPEKNFSLEYDVFPKLCGQDFFGHVVEEGFLDIGTPERFEKAKNLFAKEDK